MYIFDYLATVCKYKTSSKL